MSIADFVLYNVGTFEEKNDPTDGRILRELEYFSSSTNISIRKVVVPRPFQNWCKQAQFCFLLTIKKVYTYIYDIKQQLKCTLDFSLKLTFTLDRKKAT